MNNKKIIEDFFKKLNYKVDLTFDEDVDNLIKVTINVSDGKDSAILIGRGGDNLKAIQHILGLVLFDKTEFPGKKLMLDVNNYRKDQEERLIQLAQRIAQKVIDNREPEVLVAMSSYERRIVHMELSQHTELETESIGEPPNRRIVVRVKK